ncbi:MAG: hypothetical protein KC422_05610 [Trueperaceae bacterium]|nr:hypothetical protein [Trueperaceae bacterium]
MHALKLSTKGWHGVIADTFTFKHLDAIAQVYARDLTKQGHRRVVIGYDRRFNQQLFARHLAEQLLFRGLEVYLSQDAIPTSVLRLAISRYQMDAGIMLAAPQLPGAYAGLQLYDYAAQLLTKREYQRLHAAMQQVAEPERLGGEGSRLATLELKGVYFEALSRLLDLENLRKLSGRIYHNALSGVAEGWLEQFIKLKNLSLEVINVKRFGMSDDDLHAFRPFASNQNLIFYLNTNSDGTKLSLYHPLASLLNRQELSQLILEYGYSKGWDYSSETLGKLGLDMPWAESGSGFKAVLSAILAGDMVVEDFLAAEQNWRLSLLKEDALAITLMTLQILAAEGLSFAELAGHTEADTDWRQSFGTDRIRLRTKRFPRKFVQAIPDVLANHKVLSIQKEENLRLSLENDAWLEFSLDRQDNSKASLLVMRCQAHTSVDVKNLLMAAKSLVHTVAGV